MLAEGQRELGHSGGLPISPYSSIAAHTGLYWSILVLTGLYWSILVYTGMHQGDVSQAAAKELPPEGTGAQRGGDPIRS